jgi:hypothetical protein
VSWKSIDIAPLDREVLVTNGKFVSVARWDTQPYHKRPRPYWHMERFGHGSNWQQRDNQPTHWMPLPEPPK